MSSPFGEEPVPHELALAHSLRFFIGNRKSRVERRSTFANKNLF
jgi:hypothetical protein